MRQRWVPLVLSLWSITATDLCVEAQDAALQQAAWKPTPVPLMTEWAEQINPKHPLPEYPRPQMVRPRWTSLNGLWDYAVTQPPGVADSSGNGRDGRVSGSPRWIPGRGSFRTWFCWELFFDLFEREAA